MRQSLSGCARGFEEMYLVIGVSNFLGLLFGGRYQSCKYINENMYIILSLEVLNVTWRKKEDYTKDGIFARLTCLEED